MSVEEIIKGLDEIVVILDGLRAAYTENRTSGISDVIREAIALLRTHLDVQPNEPLTEKELRGMAGRPVWVRRNIWSVECAVVDPSRPYLWRVNGEIFYLPDIAIMRSAYRYPPKDMQ